MRTYLALGSWAILAIALSQQGTLKTIRRKYVPPTPTQRIDNIQRGFHAALDDLSMNNLREVHTKDAKGNPITFKENPQFGFARATPARILHDGVMRNTGIATIQNSPQGELQYYALSNFGKPLAASRLTLHKDVGSYAFKVSRAEAAEILDFAAHSLSSIGEKGTYSGDLLGAEAQARPLKISKPECLKCHPDSKVGDTIGVLVCVIKSSPPPNVKG